MSSSGSGSGESQGDDDATLAAVIITVLVVTYLVVWFFRTAIKVIHHAEVMIIERLGRYKTTLKPGLYWVWPIIESPRVINWRYLNARNNSAKADVVSVTRDRVDMREHVIDFSPQHVITKDTVQFEIDALVYFRVTDARVAVFNIQNLPDAVELLTQATLRNIVAQMTLDDTFSSREAINTELLGKIQRDAERWGVTITRVEIFNIDPPRDIKSAMENQIRAERFRRSTVLQADGQRESAVIKSRGDAARMVLSAEGARSAALLRAKGDADAKRLLAEAEASAIKLVRDSCGDAVRAVDYLTAVEYLNAIRNMTYNSGKKDKVVLVPVEAINGLEEFFRLNGQHMPTA